MHRRQLIFTLLLFLGLLSPLVGTTHAASIKQRMIARHPAIEALKDKGIVGENNQGYLTYRSSNHAQQSVVAAENKDRRTVYTIIARKEGVSPALVGQRRAKMLIRLGKKGQWFQAANGKWFKK